MTKTYENFIDGEWASSQDAIENHNPSDLADLIGLYAQATPDDVSLAVAAAKQAQPKMRRLPLEERQRALDFIGHELMARSQELGELLSREEGKPLAEGRGEVYRAGQFFTYYAAEALRQLGENADSVREGIEIDIRREPMGTVVVISPWNFPTATASWKIAPALAFGNSVIWKPANETPASAWALTEIISRSGLPKGAFQLLMGSGTKVGDALSVHKDVDAVTFTGSYTVGLKVAQNASSNLTKFQLELGSKNALLVMEDADIDLAVAAALSGSYSGTGQKCTASSRLIIHGAVEQEFVSKLSDRLRTMKVGHALDPATQMGPVVSERQLQANLDWIAKVKQSGATLVLGGERLELSTKGFYMAPTLVRGAQPDMTFHREELFAPFAAVQTIDSYDAGLAAVNDTDYGLVAGIFTKSLSRATHFRRNAETGCVVVNLPTAGTDYHVPFGGRKNSSFGSREQGRAAAEFYTQIKTSYIRAGEPV